MLSSNLRVENDIPIIFMSSSNDVLGLTTLNQYIYVFFPSKIRVYEQLPEQPSPDLIEEIHLSKNNMSHFSVSQHYIAVLFQDSSLQVHLRQYWEVVQHSSILKEPFQFIDGIEIDENILYYRFKAEQDHHPTFGFIDLSQKIKEKRYWRQTKPLQQLIHRHKLGRIPDFYVSLFENQIKFGMYYQQQNSTLKQFEFGILNQTEPHTKVLSIHLLQKQQEGHKDGKTDSKSIYLVKLVEQKEKKEIKEMKKKKSIHNSNKSEEKKILKLKYLKFFEEQNQQILENSNKSAQEKKLKIFEQMLFSMQQIQQNTNCQKKQFFQHTTVSPINLEQNKQKQEMIAVWNQIYLPVEKKEIQNFFILRKQMKLYLCSQTKIFCFTLKQVPSLILLKQFEQNESMKVRDICDHCLILDGQSFFTLPFCLQKKKISVKQKKKEQKLKNIPSHCKVQERQVQTEMPTDVYLDQFEQDQMSEIIQKLFEKKNIMDQQTSTQSPTLNEIQVQTESEKLQCETQVHFEKHTKEQATQVTLPVCPSCHENSLTSITTSLNRIQNETVKEFYSKMNQSVKKQHDKMRAQILQKIKSIATEVINQQMMGNLEKWVHQIIEKKLNEFNEQIFKYLKTHHINMYQELEKQAVKESETKVNFLRQQIHEMDQNKRVIAKMVEICKVRQLQKIVLFQNITDKFKILENKVLNIEGKISDIVEKQRKHDDNLKEEIQSIKYILKETGGLKLEDSEGSEAEDEGSGAGSQEETQKEVIEEKSIEGNEEEESSQEYYLSQEEDSIFISQSEIEVKHFNPQMIDQAYPPHPQPFYPPFMPSYIQYPQQTYINPGYAPTYPVQSLNPQFVSELPHKFSSNLKPQYLPVKYIKRQSIPEQFSQKKRKIKLK